MTVYLASILSLIIINNITIVITISQVILAIQSISRLSEHFGDQVFLSDVLVNKICEPLRVWGERVNQNDMC